MTWYKEYQVDVPEGISGNVAVVRFQVSKTEADIGNIRAMLKGRGGIEAGTYTKLIINHHLVMSDTPDEISDHLFFIRKAKGNVLINGLGLGVCLQAVLSKAEVEKVTVIEVNQDVINLVGPHYLNKFGPNRLEIIHADAFEYKPAEVFDAVWHDIWPYITSDNLPDMKKLHRKYGRKSKWQGSWCRKECERIR